MLTCFVCSTVGKKQTVPLPCDVTLREFQRTVEQMTRVPAEGQKVVHRYWTPGGALVKWETQGR